MEEGMDALKISAGEPTDKESSRKVQEQMGGEYQNIIFKNRCQYKELD